MGVAGGGGPEGDGPMRHQEATTVVALPLADVESRLRQVEAWSKFLHGIESIEYASHERYLFRLADGRDRRELKVVVKLLYRDHCFVWHGLSGPAWRGSLKLTPVDDHHTAVTLAMGSLPVDLRSGLSEMLMPKTTTALHDLRMLEQHLVQAGSTEPAG
jgi:hypothetical protein